MSEQMNEFDQIFRDRLSDQTAVPPADVWDAIQSERSFGHVVANRISRNWRIFGTLLMLVFAGGSSFFLFGGEENEPTIQQYEPRLIGSLEYSAIDQEEKNNQVDQVLAPVKIEQKSKKAKAVPSTDFTYDNIPEADILVSLNNAGGIGFQPVEDERLAAYIESLQNWTEPRPMSFTHYFDMKKMHKFSVNKEKLVGEPQTIDIDYDYVQPSVERKTFRERTSFVFSITPQNIHKTLRAEYNMSSEFLQNQKKAAKTRLAYSANAFMHYEVKNHKFIETGISFTQIYEEVSYEGQKRFSNKYNFVEIPLLMGFENRNAKWGWHIKGGFGVQIFNAYEGYTLKRLDVFAQEEQPLYRSRGVQKLVTNTSRSVADEQERSELVDLEDEQENPYKTSGIVNVHFAAGLTYYHSDKVSFLITPSYRRTINSITKERANFSERISYTGMSFGTMVKF